MFNSYILEEASSLEPGASRGGLLCPKCLGGRTKERSFGVTRERFGVLYNCHRASCSFRGFVATAAWASDYQPPEKVRTKRKPYTKPMVPLCEEEYEFFRDKFELTKEQIDWAGWKSGPEDGRILMPVRNSNGYDIGLTARSYDPNANKKSIAYPDGTDDVWMAYYLANQGDTVVLVEDQVSALKLSQFVPAIALLGTNFNDDKAVDVASSFSNVLAWPDADALDKGFSWVKKYKLMFRNFVVHTGSKTDPKDTRLEDIYNILYNYNIIK